MPDADRNALIRLPSFAVEKAEAGPRRILTGMVSDALAVAQSQERALEAARYRIGDYEFRDPDYRQILIWAKELHIEAAELVHRLDMISTRWRIFVDGRPTVSNLNFLVTDGSMEALAWDFDLLPITSMKWVTGLRIKNLAFKGKATTNIALSLPSLERMECFNIEISEIELSNIPALRSLDCRKNQLLKLELSNAPSLERLSCGHNKIVELKLSNVPVLTYLSCSANRLTKIDISSAPKLESLSCDQNELTELDLSRSHELNRLWCNENKLSTLDLSNNSELQTLGCGRNRLQELDLTSCPKLLWLSCENNEIQDIDVGSLRRVGHFFCDSSVFLTLKSDHLRSAAGFDRETYESVKPLFFQAISDMKIDGPSLQSAIRSVTQAVPVRSEALTASTLEQYIARFIRDIRIGLIDRANAEGKYSHPTRLAAWRRTLPRRW
jgi:hypothetical protein